MGARASKPSKAGASCVARRVLTAAICGEVFGFLPLRTVLLRCFLVCKAWRAGRAQWPAVRVRADLVAGMCCVASVRDAVLDTPAAFDAFAGARLEMLHVQCYTWKLDRLPFADLRELHLAGVGADAAWWPALRCLSRLRALALTDCAVAGHVSLAVCSAMPNLETVKLRNCHALTGADVLHCLRPTLRKLHLVKVELFACVLCSLDRVPALECIVLEQVWGRVFKDDTLWASLARVPRLHTLILTSTVLMEQPHRFLELPLASLTLVCRNLSWPAGLQVHSGLQTLHFRESFGDNLWQVLPANLRSLTVAAMGLTPRWLYQYVLRNPHVSALGLTGLSVIRVELVQLIFTWELTSLELQGQQLEWGEVLSSLVSAFPNLERLVLGESFQGSCRHVVLKPLQNLSRLRHLELRTPSPISAADLAGLATCPRFDTLVVSPRADCRELLQRADHLTVIRD